MGEHSRWGGRPAFMTHWQQDDRGRSYGGKGVGGTPCCRTLWGQVFRQVSGYRVVFALGSTQQHKECCPVVAAALCFCQPSVLLTAPDCACAPHLAASPPHPPKNASRWLTRWQQLSLIRISSSNGGCWWCRCQSTAAAAAVVVQLLVLVVMRCRQEQLLWCRP